MITAQESNKKIVALVASRLGSLIDQVVFVGGCATGFLLTDAGAPEVRFTQDVDVIVEVMTKSEFWKFEETLRHLGFHQAVGEDDPICRWKIDAVIVDFMPPDEEILGFNNRWYSDAVNTATEYKLRDTITIRLVTAPYFLATKIEAFHGRGNNDFFASHDLADIISVIDGRPELIDELKESGQELRRYAATEITQLSGLT